MKTDIIEQIKDRLDIVEFIRQYVPGLKRAGKTYKACCPFHHEKTPSFTCSSEKGLFYCFGCQEGGDIFAFLMKMENLTFREAVEKLADLAGLEYQPTQNMTAEELRRATLRKALDFARNYYYKLLRTPAAENARAYVKSRHLTKETCEHFALGLSPAPGVFMRDAKEAGFTSKDLRDAGLCIQTDYGLREYFRHRLMFPIWNQRGDTIGFGGRILAEGNPKYLNSPETILFTKSHVLYGLNFAGAEIRKQNRAVLLEGYMDVIGCHQAGFTYTVAPLGTSLTTEHARLLKRYTQNVIVLFDPDEAGLKAALRAALLLTQAGLFAKVASLPDGLDPDEYILQYGKENFEKVLNNAQDLIAFALSRQLAQYPQPLTAQAKTNIASELAQIIAEQPDPIVQREWVKFAAEQLGVEEPLILQRVQHVRKLSPKAELKPLPASAPNSPILTHTEQDLLTWMMRSPQHIVLGSELTESDFSTPAAWQIFQALVQAHIKYPQAENLTDPAAELTPAYKNEIIKLALLPTPSDFEPARDIAACVAKLEQTGIQQKLQTVTRQMKAYGTGEVPPEIFQTYMQLQQKLKKYRN